VDGIEELLSIPRRFSRISADISFDQADALTLSLSGSIENECGAALRNAIELVIAQNANLKILCIEVSGIRYASSSGLGALASVYLAAKKHGVNFTLRNPSDHLSSLFSLLGFDLILPIQRDTDEEKNP